MPERNVGRKREDDLPPMRRFSAAKFKDAIPRNLTKAGEKKKGAAGIGGGGVGFFFLWEWTEGETETYCALTKILDAARAAYQTLL